MLPAWSSQILPAKFSLPPRPPITRHWLLKINHSCLVSVLLNSYIYIIDPSPDYLLLSSIIVTPKKIYWFILLGITVKSLLYIYTPSWLFNIAMEAMAHRNRWFMMIYLLTMVISHSCVNYQSFSHWNDIISGNEHDTYLWGNHMSLLKMVISHIR